MSASVKSRAEAVAIARSYIGTPYVLGGRLKGAGVDCGTILGLHLIEIGRVTAEEFWAGIGPYSHDWFLHASVQRYLQHLLKFIPLRETTICRADAKAEPGDLVLFPSKAGKLFYHGAIVTLWPFGVHACAGGVTETNLVAFRLTAFKPMDLFDPFASH